MVKDVTYFLSRDFSLLIMIEEEVRLLIWGILKKDFKKNTKTKVRLFFWLGVWYKMKYA